MTFNPDGVLQPGTHVLITGASRGIGAAAARLFAAQGARLSLVARDSADLRALGAELGAAAQVLACDVSDASAMSDCLAKAEASFGPLEVLINNAGVIEPIGALWSLSPEAFQHAIAINLGGVFNGMRAALPGMIARGRGTIVTVSSGAAHNPVEGWTAYCTGKAGAFMLTRMADLEARPHGVRVLSLSPGTVATEMQRKIKASGVNAVSRLDWSDHIPPDWPARALLWMCSPDADAHLGQEISLRDEGLRRHLGLVA